MKRFAKIGGEMVSLAVVENCASAIWPDHTHAAVAMPDGRKGEQIVLVTSAKDANRAEILAWAQNHGVPELAVPRKIVHVDHVPVLGTGKTDYGSVTKGGSANRRRGMARLPRETPKAADVCALPRRVRPAAATSRVRLQSCR